jgi:hypothetical protein
VIVAGTAKPKNCWVSEPDDHDFPAARDYLSLLYDPARAEALAEALRGALTIGIYKAKDILRASGLQPMGRKNFHARSDLDKVAQGDRLSPVLSVRDVSRIALVIADGFHRVCASRLINEDLVIPCRIVTAV